MKSELKNLGISPRSVAKLKRAPKSRCRPSRNLRDRVNCKANTEEDNDFVSAAERRLIKDAIRRSLAEKSSEGPENSLPEAQKSASNTKTRDDKPKKTKTTKIKVKSEAKSTTQDGEAHVKTPAPSVHPLHYQQSGSSKQRNLGAKADAQDSDDTDVEVLAEDFILSDSFKQTLASAEDAISATVLKGVQGPLASSEGTVCCKCTPSVTIDTSTPSKQHHGSSGSPSPGRAQSPRRSPRNSSKDSSQSSKASKPPPSNSSQSTDTPTSEPKPTDSVVNCHIGNVSHQTVTGHILEQTAMPANMRVDENGGKRVTTVVNHVIPYLIPINSKPVEVKASVFQGFKNRTGSTIVNIISQSPSSSHVAKEPVVYKRILPKPAIGDTNSSGPSTNSKPQTTSKDPASNRPPSNSINAVSRVSAVNGVQNYIQILPKSLNEVRRSSEGQESSFLKSSINQFLARKSLEGSESAIVVTEKARRSSESNLVELKELLDEQGEPGEPESNVLVDSKDIVPKASVNDLEKLEEDIESIQTFSDETNANQADSSKENFEVMPEAVESTTASNETEVPENITSAHDEPKKAAKRKYTKKQKPAGSDDGVKMKEQKEGKSKKVKSNEAAERDTEGSEAPKPKKKYTKKRRLAETEISGDAAGIVNNNKDVKVDISSDASNSDNSLNKIRKSDASTDMNCNIIEKSETKESKAVLNSSTTTDLPTTSVTEAQTRTSKAHEVSQVGHREKTNGAAPVETNQLDLQPKIDVTNSKHSFFNASSNCPSQRGAANTSWVDPRTNSRDVLVSQRDHVPPTFQHAFRYDANTPASQVPFAAFNQSHSFMTPNLANAQLPLPAVSMGNTNPSASLAPAPMQNPFHLVQSQQSFLINSSTAMPLPTPNMLGSQPHGPIHTPGFPAMASHGLFMNNNPLHNHQVATAISMMRPTDAQALFASMLLSNQSFNQVTQNSINAFTAQFHNPFTLPNVPNPSNLVNYFTQDFIQPNIETRPALNPHPIPNPINSSSFRNTHPSTSKEFYTPFCRSYSETKTHGTFVSSQNQSQHESMSTNIAKTSTGCSSSSTSGALTISTSQTVSAASSRKNSSLSPSSSKTQPASALTPLRSPLKPNISATFLPSPKRKVSKTSPSVAIAKLDSNSKNVPSKTSPLVLDAKKSSSRVTDNVPFRPEQSDNQQAKASNPVSSSKTTCTIAIQTDRETEKGKTTVDVVSSSETVTVKKSEDNHPSSSLGAQSGVFKTSSDSEVGTEIQSPIGVRSSEDVNSVAEAPAPRKRGRPARKVMVEGTSTAPTSQQAPIKLNLPKLNTIKVFSIDEKNATDPVSFYVRNKEDIRKLGAVKVASSKNFRTRASFRENEKFSMDLQYISRAYKRWGPNTRDWLILQRHLMFQNTELTEAPSACGGIEIDIPQLLKSVELCGGFDWVSSRKRWDKVAEHMGAPKSLLTRFASKLESVFQSKLLDFSILNPDERSRIEQMVDDDDDVHSQLGAISWAPTSTSLNVFRKLAENVFTFYTASLNLKSVSTRLDRLEALYWGLVYERKQHVTVQFAKVCSSIVGSGFSSKSSASSSSDKCNGWNLCNVPVNRQNSLRGLSSRGDFSGVREKPDVNGAVSGLSGISTPFIKAAMLFSTEFITTDPQGLPFVEYLHEGTKIWYVFKKDSIAALWNSAKKTMPELSNTDLSPRALTKHNLMIPPCVLDQDGVEYDRIVQTAGDFVVVSPDCFYCSVSLDAITVSECCYFADTTWLLDEASIAFRESRTDGVPLLFPLEELLFLMACRHRANKVAASGVAVDEGHGMSETEMRKVKGALKTYIDEEKANREALKTSFNVTPVDESEAEFELPDWSDCTCDVCEYPCFFSLLLDEDDETMYCLNHGLQEVQRTGNATGFKLIQNITNMELERVFSD